MSRRFDPIGHVIQVGRELVLAFEGGGFATTSGQIGSARESPLRRKLRQLLPGGVGIGSGCIIDSYGNTSKQMDVVLYEIGVTQLDGEYTWDKPGNLVRRTG